MRVGLLSLISSLTTSGSCPRSSFIKLLFFVLRFQLMSPYTPVSPCPPLTSDSTFQQRSDIDTYTIRYTHTKIKENNVSDTSRTPVVKFNKTFYHMFMLATCLQSSQKRKFLSNQPIHWVLIRQPIGQIQRQSFTNHVYCLSASF